MQITVDVRSLTAAEKLHLAQFITDYPSGDVQSNAEADGVNGFEISCVDEDIEEVPSPSSSFGPSLVPSPAVISPNTVQTVVLPPPPPPVTQTSTGVVVDKAGLPWDERIHASSKNFVADGTWRKRRNVADETFAQVEGELRALMNIPAPVAVAAVPPPPPPLPTAQIPVPVEAPPVTTAPIPPPPPPAPAAVEPNAYLNLIQFVTKVLTEKKLSRDEVKSVVRGVDPSLNLQLLQKRPDLCPAVVAGIQALVA